MIRLIVFDFDGTLVDSKSIYLHLIKKDLKNSGHKINRKFVHSFGDKPLKGMLEMIGMSDKEMPPYLKVMHEDFIKYAKRITGAKNLRSVGRIRMKKLVLSNSVHRIIKTVLADLNADYFNEVFGADDFKSKFQEFNKIIKKYKLKPREIVYVGDRVIDVKLARKVGCYSVIVSNKSSWSPRKELIRARPDFIIGDLGKVEKIVRGLQER